MEDSSSCFLRRESVSSELAFRLCIACPGQKTFESIGAPLQHSGPKQEDTDRKRKIIRSHAGSENTPYIN
eukprot:1137222-Pelagomonas_calceolata.AAC.3